MSPETPLPWREFPDCSVIFLELDVKQKDQDFMVHACNAYPKMVEMLKQCMELELPYHDELLRAAKVARLLKELGELK